MSFETSPGTPEQTRPSEAELINTYLLSDGTDLETGRALTHRLLEHAYLPSGLATMPLVGRDGLAVHDGSRQLQVQDYINYAAQHHIGALGSIFGFLDMQPGTEEYDATRTAMVQRLSAGQQ